MGVRFLITSLFQLAIGTVAFCQLSQTSLPPIVKNYKVAENNKGQLVTTFDIYRSDGSVLVQTYLGSPYMSFPIWQPGTINVDGKGESLPCEIAYDLFSEEIFCRFADSDKETLVLPVAFSINGVPFMSKPIRYREKSARTYFAVFNSGSTKFLVNYRREHDPYWNRPLTGDARIFDGEYVSVERYYIQKGDSDLIEIELTSKSLLTALSDKANQIREKIKSKKLTKNEVVSLLAYYDSLPGSPEKFR